MKSAASLRKPVITDKEKPNLEKTRIVYCKDEDRKGNHEYTSFDFLGYTFRPRHAKNRYGKFFTNFLPAVSEKAKKAIRKQVRSWKLQHKSDKRSMILPICSIERYKVG